MAADRRQVKALSIRQPWAELILRGVKTVEYRSRPTRVIGERFWIYAAGRWPVSTPARRDLERATRIWSRDLAMPDDADAPPKLAWMFDMLAQILACEELPTGVIVGSAVIEKVTGPSEPDGLYRWHLSEVRRARRLRKPERHPQPAWFVPFERSAA